ncbi:MAG: protein kinase [Candidatus Wallbacteria bacterium]|nr:protein kinase [Candidatus Wallbacteria bacterium]
MLLAGDNYRTYRILEFIGAGGAGSVYRAVQEGLEREVALKVVDIGGRSASEDRKRFLREARSLSKLRHPSIIRIYDFGEDENRLYYSMELAPGSSVDRKLKEGVGLPPAEACSWVSQVLDALEAVHAVGVLHRDIKPANVLLRPDGTVMLWDFGLAQEANSTRMTVRADLYQTGVLLFELLSGTVPYSTEEVLGMLKGQPVEPGRPIAVIAPAVGPGLAEFLTRAMDPEPTSRFQTAREMRDALESVRSSGGPSIAVVAVTRSTPASGRSLAARRPSSGVRKAAPTAEVAALETGRFPKHPWALAGALAVALLMALTRFIGSPAPGVPKAARPDAGSAAVATTPAVPLRRTYRQLAAELLRSRLLAERELLLTPTAVHPGSWTLEVALPAVAEIASAEWIWGQTGGRSAVLAEVNGHRVEPAALRIQPGLLVNGNNRFMFSVSAGPPSGKPAAKLRIQRRAGASLALRGPSPFRRASPDSPLGSMLEKAKKLFESGLHTEALATTKKALDMAPDDWETRWKWGFALHLGNYFSGEMKRFGGALELLTVTEGDPEKMRPEAFRHMNRALELNPLEANIWHDLGLCYRNEFFFADAERMLAMACLLNERLFRYWWELALILDRGIPRGQERDHPLSPVVLAVARAALDPESETQPAWYLERGNFFRRFWRFDEARADYAAALAAEPSNAKARAGLDALGGH